MFKAFWYIIDWNWGYVLCIENRMYGGNKKGITVKYTEGEHKCFIRSA